MEIKVGARDEPKELEKFKCKQVDKDFANWPWLMGIVLQVQPEKGPVPMKYQDLIHRV